MKKILVLLVCLFMSSSAYADALRGDVDGNQIINITDVIYLSNFIYSGGPPPPCPEAADVNDDRRYDIVDIVLLYDFLFGGCGACVPFEVVDC
jgi:hypothetical protein